MSKSITSKSALAVLGLAVTSAIATSVSATPITNVVIQEGDSHKLSALLANPDSQTIPGVVVFDKLFYNFHYTPTGLSMPAAGDVTVESHTTVTPEATWGLRFSGAFQDTGAPGASDAFITYEVQVLDPTKFITDAHLAGDPLVVGSGQMSVEESWTPDQGNTVISISDLEPGHNLNLTASVIFAIPTQHLFVQKDILAHVNDGSTTSVAVMSFVDQTFSQGNVPEPASVGLLGLGLAGLLARRRK